MRVPRHGRTLSVLVWKIGAAPAELLRPSPDPCAVPGAFWKVPRGSSGLPQEFRAVPAELGRSGGQSGEDLRGHPSERLAVPGDRDGSLLPSGGSLSCSRISLQRSVVPPRRSGAVPRCSRAAPRRSVRARTRSAAIVCSSAGVPRLSAGRCAATSGSCAAVRLQLSSLGSCDLEGRRCWRRSSICRPSCNCASVLAQCHPVDPAPDLCGDLPAEHRSLSHDRPLKPAQHVGGLRVCFRVRRCAPFWPSPACFAAGVGSSIPSGALRRCAPFWTHSCTMDGCASGICICGHICHAAATLEPLCAFCGVVVSPISPGRIRGLCAVYEPSDGGVLDPSPEGSPAQSVIWPLWSGTGSLIRQLRRGVAAIRSASRLRTVIRLPPMKPSRLDRG